MTRVWQETSQLSNPPLRDPAYAPADHSYSCYRVANHTSLTRSNIQLKVNGPSDSNRSICVGLSALGRRRVWILTSGNVAVSTAWRNYLRDIKLYRTFFVSNFSGSRPVNFVADCSRIRVSPNRRIGSPRNFERRLQTSSGVHGWCRQSLKTASFLLSHPGPWRLRLPSYDCLGSSHN
jgi:hypothetical protein